MSGSTPENPEIWGWKNTNFGWQSSGTLIGWIEAEDVYFQPDACFKTIQDMAKNSFEQLSIGAATLWKRLDERRLLKSKEENRCRLSVRKVIAGNRRAVIHLDKSTLWSSEPSQPSQKDESNSQSSIYKDGIWAGDCPIEADDDQKPAHVMEASGDLERVPAATDQVNNETEFSADCGIEWQESKPCRTCKGTRYWRRSASDWICQTCHPCPETGKSTEKTVVEAKLVSGTERPESFCMIINKAFFGAAKTADQIQ
jgi:hypothetical protein